MEAVRPIRPRCSSDKDGSLGGGPNSYVIIHDGVNDSIAVDAEACEIKPTWNAAVCKGDVGRMTVGGAGGGGGGGGPGGPGAAKGGPGGPGAAKGGPGGPVAAGGPVLAQPRAVLVALAQPRVVLVVLAQRTAVRLDLLSRQSFSAAMARSTP